MDAKQGRYRVREEPNSHYAAPGVLKIERHERWEAILNRRIHEVNRSEVERLLVKVRALGSEKLTQARRPSWIGWPAPEESPVLSRSGRVGSTTRFSDRVEAYVASRPSYPNELFDFLKTDLGLEPRHTIVGRRVRHGYPLGGFPESRQHGDRCRAECRDARGGRVGAR